MKKFIVLALFANFCLLVVGQTATYDDVVSKKVKGSFEIYVTKTGEVFKVGDTITIGFAFRNEQYDYIRQNAGIETYPVTNSISSSKVVIKSFKIRARSMYVYTTRPIATAYGLMIMNFDGALESGEVKSKIMSSDEALMELKKWKDKLDLELISQEEYETKKKELSKYIN